MGFILLTGFIAYKLLTKPSARPPANRETFTSTKTPAAYPPPPPPEPDGDLVADLSDDEPPAEAVIAAVSDAFENEQAIAKGQEGERRVNRVLQALGRPYLSNVYLRDELGELTQIDHLVKMQWGIVVIETKTYGGFISGTANPDRWKQSFRKFGSRKYYLFQNPFRQNYRHICVVQYVSGLQKNVFSRVVLAGDARTSLFIHKQVIRLRGLKSELQKRPENAPNIDFTNLDLAWNRLRRQAKANEGCKAEHLGAVKARSFQTE
ncbi:nuclease-related domain-containing protein [Acetobacter sp.]|uniref:nuclease-related domain-containing protein n=1 Tax=Acetobacter sp. TaxID=440 RepID=UPI0025BA0E2B|nr:nuclease-related domain-containing protein [Acetobacter sp.]MCH4092691.1 NERD domain-containing protein [Acetobacter sp.]MCI1301207.1 NERD domain-containing protein [Acetobacter sp.]MCI1317468.1 NERD domain-containing protein [Acetobacter sp.]